MLSRITESALATMVLAVVNQHHARLHTPLQVRGMPPPIGCSPTPGPAANPVSLALIASFLNWFRDFFFAAATRCKGRRGTLIAGRFPAHALWPERRVEHLVYDKGVSSCLLNPPPPPTLLVPFAVSVCTLPRCR